MTNKNLYIVILAGGSGTRFWPLSRKKEPKQFLNIPGPDSLLQKTVSRIKDVVAGKQIYIITNKTYLAKVKQQIKTFSIPLANILLEPEGKNTAPAVCWAAAHIYKKNRAAIMTVLPSDHLILNKKAFLKKIETGVQLAQNDYLVTLGIVPTRPETGYGYLKIKSSRKKGQEIWKVEKFTEKPNTKKAEQFVKTKRYLWNSGMFIWKCETILAEMNKHLPTVYKFFKDKCGAAHVKSIWHKLPSISIDYGVLEKSSNVVTVPAPDIAWSDLGSWESLAEEMNTDGKGNILKGDVVAVDCKDTFVWGQDKKDKRLIATVGLENIVIVDTDDALLVCRKDLSQQVKDVVEVLKKKKKEYL